MVTLGRDVEDVGAINVPSMDVCLHIVYQSLDQFKISMIGGEMESCKFLVSRQVYPVVHGVLGQLALIGILSVKVVLKGVVVNYLETLGMVFERRISQQ